MEYLDELDDEILDAIFDESMSYEELEELFFNNDEDNDVDFLETWLKKENLTYDEAKEQRNEKQKRLLDLAKQFQFPLENKFEACKRISEQENFTSDLEEFLCLFLSEQGNLLNPNPELSEKELIIDYALDCEEYQKTKSCLDLVESLRQHWLNLKPLLLSDKEASIPRSNVTTEELIKLYCSVFADTNPSEIFKYNMEIILGDINRLESYRKIAPLYIYQIIINHTSRLKKNKDIVINLKSLWNYKDYEIQKDNGKNFKQNRKNLEFFERLCSLFQKDTSVNILLNRWGFMLLSNLVDFHRSELEFKLDSVFPCFDKILDVSLFSCCINTEDEAVLLKETGYSLKKVEYYQSVPSYEVMLDKISQYMNENALTLLEFIIDEKPMKTICTDILLESKLKKSERPISQRELDLCLCTINLGLLEIVDYFAKEHIVLGLINIFRDECR